MFPHTFHPHDVDVLLERITPIYLSSEERQALIDGGQHYNELLSKEAIPDDTIMDLFKSQVHHFGDAMAEMVVTLARIIHTCESIPVLVSLVRAGTPTGILVKRALGLMGVKAPHFSVSIVQGRGFDEVAIEHILSLGYRPEQLIFIDGWTGKGVVRRELSAALKTLSDRYGAFRDELFVLSDIAGVAEHAATREDVLIPSALLSGPLCGLVSRSLYRGSPNDPQMHGAALLDYMHESDVSQWFVDTMMSRLESALARFNAEIQVRPAEEAQAQMSVILRDFSSYYGVSSVDKIKPGIGESSRLFIRKVPKALIIKDSKDPQVKHLIQQAIQKKTPVYFRPSMFCRAITIME